MTSELEGRSYVLNPAYTRRIGANKFDWSSLEFHTGDPTDVRAVSFGLRKRQTIAGQVSNEFVAYPNQEEGCSVNMDDFAEVKFLYKDGIPSADDLSFYLNQAFRIRVDLVIEASLIAADRRPPDFSSPESIDAQVDSLKRLAYEQLLAAVWQQRDHLRLALESTFNQGVTRAQCDVLRMHSTTQNFRTFRAAQRMAQWLF